MPRSLSRAIESCLPKEATLSIWRIITFSFVKLRLSRQNGANRRVHSMSAKAIAVRCLILGIFAWPAPQPVSAQQSQSQAQIGYKSSADADAKKTLLLKEFDPASMFHAPAHTVDRAKFYVIDVHNHQNDAMCIDDHMPPARVARFIT